MNSKHTDSKCTVHDVTFVNIVCVCIAYYTQLHVKHYDIVRVCIAYYTQPHCQTLRYCVCVCIAYYTQLHCQTRRYSFISSFTPSSNN